MSPLWSNSEIDKKEKQKIKKLKTKKLKTKKLKIKKPEVKKLKTHQKKSSPKRHNDYHNFAQKNCPNKFNADAIKGISLFASLPRCVVASMTVEAAIVLPLFLFFFLNLGCAIELIRLHGNLEFALCDIGNRMAVYGYVLSGVEQENEWVEELKDVVLSYTYVKKEIVDYLGEQYLEESPIEKGMDGLLFLESEIFGEEDCFELVVTYQVDPFSNVAGFGSFRMANRYYGHVWNGYQIPGTDDGDVKEDVVYVAENGSVYHEDRNCSHISLSVREVSLQKAYESRNVNGGKYEPCVKCKNAGAMEKVYITDEGESIHYKKDCAALKRTVYALNLKNAGRYQPCTRCVQK